MAAVIDIPPLLHDARLCGCRWDRHLNALDLSFHCLRRNVDGTPVEDGPVVLRLGGVERVVADYSPAGVTVRPSEFEPCSRLTPADLDEWPHGPVEAHLAVNSPQAEFEAATACVRDVLVGDPNAPPGVPPLPVHVALDPHGHGPQDTAAGLSIDCHSLEPFADGVPLDIGTWGRQFEAWWAGWRAHWAAKDRDSADQESVVEDTVIPAGPSPPPDLAYRPPAAEPVLVTPTDCPAELLKPIEDYHAGFHGRDWLRVATAFPHLDHTPEERATRLRDQYLGWDHGRWVYVRRLDGWWREGDRACVVVRGIEHRTGDEGSPDENEETVITYDLRQSRRGWVIAAWSQGWPRFGSADRLPAPQPWQAGWGLPG